MPSACCWAGFRNGGLSAAGHHRAGLLAGRRVSHGHQALAEYRMIGDKSTAALYRKSFGQYTEQSLLISAFFYAMCSLFLCGIFIIKYKIELLLVVPFLCGLFCFYFHLAFKKDSAVQKPEKLYREKGLLMYMIILAAVFFWRCSSRSRRWRSFSTPRSSACNGAPP